MMTVHNRKERHETKHGLGEGHRSKFRSRRPQNSRQPNSPLNQQISPKRLNNNLEPRGYRSQRNRKFGKERKGWSEMSRKQNPAGTTGERTITISQNNGNQLCNVGYPLMLYPDLLRIW
jgi:hypothetical protein